jgi:hypothetical protein
MSWEQRQRFSSFRRTIVTLNGIRARCFTRETNSRESYMTAATLYGCQLFNKGCVHGSKSTKKGKCRWSKITRTWRKS